VAALRQHQRDLHLRGAAARPDVGVAVGDPDAHLPRARGQKEDVETLVVVVAASLFAVPGHLADVPALHLVFVLEEVEMVAEHHLVRPDVL